MLISKADKLCRIATSKNGWCRSSSTANSIIRSLSTKQRSIIDDASGAAEGRAVVVEVPSASGNSNPVRRFIQRYSISAQQNRIQISQRLFRSAQRQATDRRWHTHCHVDVAFRPMHALLTLHIWLVHRRSLLSMNAEETNSLKHSATILLQDEYFETFWHDTKVRIRHEKVQELMVEKSLRDVQNYTFQHFMALDHAIDKNNEHLFDNPRIKEDVGLALWTHVYRSNEQIDDEVVDCLADYVLQQYHNIVHLLPQKYFDQGRIKWIECPSEVISSLAGVLDDSTGVINDRLGDKLPPHWFTNLTDAGELYYWNEQTMISSWERPS